MAPVKAARRLELSPQDHKYLIYRCAEPAAKLFILFPHAFAHGLSASLAAARNDLGLDWDASTVEDGVRMHRLRPRDAEHYSLNHGLFVNFFIE